MLPGNCCLQQCAVCLVSEVNMHLRGGAGGAGRKRGRSGCFLEMIAFHIVWYTMYQHRIWYIHMQYSIYTCEGVQAEAEAEGEERVLPVKCCLPPCAVCHISRSNIHMWGGAGGGGG